MEVKVASRSQSRRKRMAGLTCDEKSHEIRCCRYPLTVDFDQFGWEWIIAPRRYEANYCSGECPFVFLPHYPHTHLVQQATNLHGLNGPCCSPRRMSSISMLYLDHNYNIIYGILPNMVVERCGCSWYPGAALTAWAHVIPHNVSLPNQSLIPNPSFWFPTSHPYTSWLATLSSKCL